MEELFEDMLPTAVRFGLSVFDFWKMTYGEIKVFIEESVKGDIANNYSLATMIALFVNNGLNGKRNPSIEELYPQLFSNTVAEEDNTVAYNNFIRDQWITFAEHHNKRRKQKEGDGL